MGTGLAAAALRGLTVPGPDWGRRRLARRPSGTGRVRSLLAPPQPFPAWHGPAQQQRRRPAAMATPPHHRTAPARSPPPGIFKPPARALAVGFPEARSDWPSQPVPAARRLGRDGRRGRVLLSDWPASAGGRPGPQKAPGRAGRGGSGVAGVGAVAAATGAPLSHGRYLAEPGAAAGGLHAGERKKRSGRSCGPARTPFGPTRPASEVPHRPGPAAQSAPAAPLRVRLGVY